MQPRCCTGEVGETREEAQEAALGPAVRPVVAGGSGGCRLKINCSALLAFLVAVILSLVVSLHHGGRLVWLSW